jgi:CRISPR/Cas system-associated endonuclease Cas3-HD
MTTMTQEQFAKHIDRVPGYITQLKDAGRLVMENGQVNVEASVERIRETANPSFQIHADRHQEERERKAAGILDDMTGKAGSAYQQARAMREKYAAMQAKISYEKEIGLLLVAHDVKMAVADGDAIIRNRLESLPDILAPQLAAEKDEQRIRMILADQIEFLLEELSRTFRSMEKI